MKGPRVFAFVVLLALALLPKTGWIVRNEADVLIGRWGKDDQVIGPLPSWAFEGTSLQDPVARAIRPDIGTQGRDFAAKWASYGSLLSDPVLGARTRGTLLRRSLSASVPHADRPEPPEKQAIARQLLPLALAGEAAERDNAFYPLTAWGLYVLLRQSHDAADALARAARCPRYDDASFEEPLLFREGFERQYGYRGSRLRLIEAMTVWLPHLTVMRESARIVLANAGPNDPARSDLVRVGATIVRTSPTLIGMAVGRNLVFQAIGALDGPQSGNSTKRALERAPKAYVDFLKANPDFRDAGQLDLALKVRDLEPFAKPLDAEPILAFATPAGAVLLFALLGALALAWPSRREERTDFEGRLRRASWAWIGLIPVAFYDARLIVYGPMLLLAALSVALARRGTRRAGFVVGGIVALAGVGLFAEGWIVPALIWIAALTLSERGRPFAWGAALLGTGGMVVFLHLNWTGTWPLIDWGLLMLAVRLALPLRKGSEWISAALAALYLGGVVVELRADAQAAEVVRQVDTETARFRAERGI